MRVPVSNLVVLRILYVLVACEDGTDRKEDRPDWRTDAMTQDKPLLNKLLIANDTLLGMDIALGKAARI